MKAFEKRFSTLELVTYRLSNSTKVVFFDNIEDAASKAVEQKKLHPRSKKLTGTIYDSKEKTTIKIDY